MMQHCPPMMTLRDKLPSVERRTLLRVGAGAAVVLAVAGGGIAYWRPGVSKGRLSDSGRRIFRTVGNALLDGSLPAEAAARETALTQWLQRLDDTIAALPKALRDELAQLLALLNTTPGRRWLTGLGDDWSSASVPQIQAALQLMRVAPSQVRQQAYHALHELASASYFAAPSTWRLMGYPGPTDI
jgi:hypothetical protein